MIHSPALQPLRRPRYVTGQLLTAEDFDREQQYVLDRLRRHNRSCHGMGVVSGLELRVRGPAAIVSPGLALDCLGDEIVLPAEATVVLPPCPPCPEQYLVIAAAEEVDERGVTESWSLTWSPADPGKGHRERYRRWDSCGTAHGISLGRVRWAAGRWRVNRAYHPRRVRA